MVLASGIGRVSAESKSISGRSQRWGYKAELQVIRLLQTKKYQLIVQRFKTQVAEIDLILAREQEILLIEVKTLENNWRAFDRISESQSHKLKLNLVFLSRRFPSYSWRAFVAWVDCKNQISFVEMA